MSSQQTAAASNRAAIAKIQEVVGRVDKQDTAIAALEAKNAAQGATIDHQADQIKRLESNKEHSVQFARLVQAELEAHKKRMDYFQSLLQFSYAASGVAPPEGVLDDTDVDLINAALGDGVGSIDLSARDKEIQTDARFKAVVNQTLHNLYGVPHLRDLHFLEYPPVPMDDDEWPSTTDAEGQRIPYMRFNFAHPFSEPSNWHCLKNWTDYIINHGATVTPVASILLPTLTREDVLTGCKLRFTYLRGVYRRKTAGAANTSTDQAGAPAPNVPTNQQIDPTLQETPPETAVADIRSRAGGKRNARARKRNLLTGDAAKFKELKYDSYFTPGAMSDDEDTYERVGGVWVKKKGVFTAREWTFISQELSSNQLRECRDAVDCIEDPNDRARTTSRVRGEPKIGQPRKWDSIDRAMRKWMIDPAVLLAHPEWVANNLVLNNGTAWGDATEPLDGATKKRKRGGKSKGSNTVAGPGPLTEQARDARRAMQEAQKHSNETGGGESLEDVVMMLG